MSELERVWLTSADLRTAWEEHAREWIAWARTVGHDSYWRFHREQFLELVPAPRSRTLDLGCGEGRLARDLSALGHGVVAVDASPTLIDAAREADSEGTYVLADAAALPFADGEVDCVVTFMSLQDVDDLAGAVAESARVLVDGGRLAIAIVHPLNSAGGFRGSEPNSPFVIDGSYLGRARYAERVARDHLEMTFFTEHRPLESYVAALADAGFLIERIREPAIPDDAFGSELSLRWRRIPLFLHLRAIKA